jgi:hypothetical protein
VPVGEGPGTHPPIKLGANNKISSSRGIILMISTSTP